MGRAVTPQDASLKVTGTAVYTYDCSIPGTLHAKLVTSTMPHARITRIDTTASKAVPGVVAVLTGQDMPFRVGMYAGDRDLLAVEKVRWSGHAERRRSLDARRDRRDLDELPVPLHREADNG